MGSAETDEQLESVINKFLCPVLLKLSSNEENVRKKVMELLVHFNKRVKSRPNLQLPVKELMNLYQDPSSSSFLSVIHLHEIVSFFYVIIDFPFQNFAIIYIKMGFPRLELTQQAELLPLLLESLNDKPVQHQDNLLFIALPGLAFTNVSTELTKQPYAFLKEKPNLAKYIRDFFLDVILLPYGYFQIQVCILSKL